MGEVFVGSITYEKHALYIRGQTKPRPGASCEPTSPWSSRRSSNFPNTSSASRTTSAACTLRSRPRATLQAYCNLGSTSELRELKSNAPANSPRFRAPRHGPRGPHGGARAPPDVAQGAPHDNTRPRRARRPRGAPNTEAAHVRR